MSEIHVEDFAVGGQPAVEIVAVPGSEPLLAIIDVFLRHIDPAADHVGLADAVNPAALRHGLAKRHDTGTRGDAIFGIDAACETCPRRRSWRERGTPATAIGASRHQDDLMLAVESPSAPITISTGRVPTSRHPAPYVPTAPTSASTDNIPQWERGGNGDGARRAWGW